WALFCQMIGRGLRVLPNTIEGIPDATARRDAIRASDKADCIVIDVVDNGRRAPTMKEETVDPSLSGIIDLPPDLDLEGHSLMEAMGKWERLDARAQALLFRRTINFDELDSTLTAVDLISELTLPNEVVEFSRNAWMKVGDGRYMLACGSTSVEGHKMALLECDALGFYDLTLSSGARDPLTFPCGMALMEAFKRADRTIKEVWPFTGGLTMSVAGWRKETVRRDQIEELRSLGVDETALAMIENAGQAWTLLELTKNSKIGSARESLVI
ncbi:MAG TPA: hypothetical protein VK934_04265, partial [Fimbriimonas sp.]|nr:hypothetical protein [Fimbriimonas sp.]